ncbi:MAG: hypothetical protein MUQ30_09930, partial [Anaerolineae bacterium]|nr:hypothetical protein [Anaerolineae bacterium]
MIQNVFEIGAFNNYLIGGNVCNAFALGNLGSADDFFLVGAEPADEVSAGAEPADGASAGAEPGDEASVDDQDENEAVAEVETSVEEATPVDEVSAGAEPAGAEPGDGASDADETEA